MLEGGMLDAGGGGLTVVGDGGDATGGVVGLFLGAGGETGGLEVGGGEVAVGGGADVGVLAGGTGDFVGEEVGEEVGDCAMVEVKNNTISTTKARMFEVAIVEEKS
jgi:hypothetical protein